MVKMGMYVCCFYQFVVDEGWVQFGFGVNVGYYCGGGGFVVGFGNGDFVVKVYKFCQYFGMMDYWDMCFMCGNDFWVIC